MFNVILATTKDFGIGLKGRMPWHSSEELKEFKYRTDNSILVMGRKTVAGSLIGGLKETQEMLDFCGKHNIVSDVEMINIENINTAYDRVKKADVKYRFVIDMESLK